MGFSVSKTALMLSHLGVWWLEHKVYIDLIVILLNFASARSGNNQLLLL